MSWISENKIPAAIIGVSAVGAIALGVMVFNAYSSYSESLASFETLNGNIATMKRAPLAPTPQNLAAKKALVGDYSAQVNTLARVLVTLQKPDVPITSTEFQAKLKTRIAAVRKLAAERQMQLPPDFNLAFDKYNAELPKSNEVATQLSTYLDAVEATVNLLISSGVRGLDVFERSELPSEKDGPAAPPPNQAAKKAPPAKKGAPGARGAAPAAASVSERYQVRIVATTDQAPLQLLIGKLASPSETPDMPYFPIVRLLRIENERQEGPAVTATLPAPPVVDPNAPVTPQPAGGAKPAQPDSIMILGNERLKVFLEIDLVKFLTAKAPAAAR
jgi:hypothetical protein